MLKIQEYLTIWEGEESLKLHRQLYTESENVASWCVKGQFLRNESAPHIKISLASSKSLVNSYFAWERFLNSFVNILEFFLGDTFVHQQSSRNWWWPIFRKAFSCNPLYCFYRMLFLSHAIVKYLFATLFSLLLSCVFCFYNSKWCMFYSDLL